MHLSRAIAPAEKLRLFSRKNEDQKSDTGGIPTHTFTFVGWWCYPKAYWSS